MPKPEFPARWGVAEHELIAETFSSRIWKVARRRQHGCRQGPQAATTFEDERRGAAFLAWRRGEAR